tara:strand:- start:1309 stop:1530 length:222 start_codon:yes stop_codon:yes gene_type:complete
MTKRPPITGFLGVFEEILNKLKKELQKELALPKAERKKDNIHKQLKHAKQLRDTLKNVKKTVAKKCPHCGGVL